MKDEELLAEVEELLRTTPPLSAFMKKENDEDNDEWFGRVASVLSEWDSIRCAFANMHWYIKALQQNHNIRTARRALRTLLFQSQHDLRMKTVGPLSIAVGANKPFTYFDEIRKITEQAREDLLFVDPYLDTEFVSRYLPQIDAGVTVRLLTSKKLPSLLPAVDAFVAEHKLQVQVRSPSSDLHDRFVFLDKTKCYQSGASFKDGAKKSLTTITQITDGFEAMHQHYEAAWNEAETMFPVDPI